AGDYGFGSPGVDDVLSIELYTSDTGSFDLGSADNLNYQTCAQCVFLYGDYDGTNAAATMFQTGGELYVDAATPPGSNFITATLTDLTVAEVTIDDLTAESTLVPGGACGGFDGTVDVSSPACAGSCGAHVCGDDGCGGTCGDGCATGTCTLGGACTPTPTCLQVSIGGDDLFMADAYFYGVDITAAGAAGVDFTDVLQLEFYSAATGNNIALATGANANYETCNQCVRAFVDVDGGGPLRQFFQSAGTMSLAAGSNVELGPVTIGFTGLRLVEVTVDDSFVSTPVPGGACIDVTVTSPLTAGP
ncbi:MAG: hypothetical protein KC635_25040, partial [Myxococcales bacterium]|nr:hypothetical protein [Myxococcales bacterium]